MHEFIPRPQYSSEEWRRFSDDFGGPNAPNCAVDVFKPPFTELTWIAWGNYYDEWAAPIGGYLFPFATSTDCLLWMRWAVLGVAIDYIENCIDIDEAANDIARLAICQIDTAAPGTGSELLLEALEYTLDRLYCGFEVYRFESIHEYLAEHGSVEEWRAYLNADDIHCIDGFWQMSPESWQKLYDAFEMVGFTHISAETPE